MRRFPILSIFTYLITFSASCLTWMGHEFDPDDKSGRVKQFNAELKWMPGKVFNYYKSYRIPRIREEKDLVDLQSRFEDGKGADDAEAKGMFEAGFGDVEEKAGGLDRIALEITPVHIWEGTPVDKDARGVFVGMYTFNLFPVYYGRRMGYHVAVRDKKGALLGVYSPMEYRRGIVWLPLWPVGILKSIFGLAFDRYSGESENVMRLQSAMQLRTELEREGLGAGMNPARSVSGGFPLGRILETSGEFAILPRFVDIPGERGDEVEFMNDEGESTGSGRIAGVLAETLLIQMKEDHEAEIGDRVLLIRKGDGRR